MVELERVIRARIKRVLRGFVRAKRGRAPSADPVGELKLGRLERAGLTTEWGLEFDIRAENLLEKMRGRGEWIARKRWEWDGDELGALLAPDGRILRRSISQETFRQLLALDVKAEREPEAVSEGELEWAREVVGMVGLEVAGGAVRDVVAVG